MSSKYIGDLCFSTGEYEKDGEKRKRWAKAAAAFKDEESGRVSFKFEAFPAAEWSGWMSLFPAKNKDNNQAPQTGHDKAVEARSKLSSPTTDDEYSSDPIDLSDIPF